MSTFKIGSPNWAESGYTTFGSVGSWGSPSTLPNLLDPDFSTAAVSTDATTANTQFNGDVLAVKTIYGGTAPGADCLMIPKHNFTQNATIRVMLGTAAFTANGGGGGTIQYDSGVIAAMPAIVYPPNVLLWGHINTWTGAPDPIVDASYNRCCLVQFGQTITYSYFWVGVVDTANPDGFVSMNRLFVGPFWQPSKNFDYGVTIEPQGTRAATESSDNSDFIDPLRRLKRVVTFSISDVPIDEATGVFLPLMMYLKYSRQAAFIFDPADLYHMQRRAFMVTQLKPGALQYANFGTNTVPNQLQEVI